MCCAIFLTNGFLLEPHLYLLKSQFMGIKVYRYPICYVYLTIRFFSPSFRSIIVIRSCSSLKLMPLIMARATTTSQVKTQIHSSFHCTVSSRTKWVTLWAESHGHQSSNNNHFAAAFTHFRETIQVWKTTREVNLI